MSDMTSDLQPKIKFLRGVAEKTRLSILLTLREGEKTVNDITALTGGTQSNISQHLACLKGCGVISRRQEGKYCYYALSGPHMLDFLNMLDVLMDEIGCDVACCGLNASLVPGETDEQKA
ncbi:hypothetical protein BFS13_10050 [Pantoea sp. Ae16]|nr:hypothetical protein BFS13_10050 [Pantoea sp. Ae16]